MDYLQRRSTHPLLVAATVLAVGGSLSCSPSGAGGGGLRFDVVVAEGLIDEPLDGRIILLVSPDSMPEPRFQQLRSPMAPALFGIDVEGLAAGQAAVVDAGARGWPVERVDLLPPGDYFVQAVANVYTTFNRADGHVIKAHMDQWEGQHWNRSPGNLVSEVQRIHVDPNAATAIQVALTRKMPAIEPPADTKYVRHLKFRSDMLSEWWGRDIDLGAVVVLPAGYDEHPDAHYPVVYWHGHFPSTFNGFRESPPDPALTGRARDAAESGYRLFQDWVSGKLGRFIIVLMQHPTPFYDDSYAVNSANNGPYGDALTQELMPRVESEFRAIGEPWARTLSGGSTGGWESLAWQVFYPDMFNGTWTFCPDPVDFRHFQLVNIYEDDNAFRPNGTFKTTPVRPWQRATDDQVSMSQQDASHLEAVLGSRGRSGDQMDIFMGVYGPVGDDGYPRLLYDKWTGEIDKGVVDYWRENYDLRHILERDWATLGPKLKGKLHLYIGEMDTYFLEEAALQLQDFLEGTTDPYYDGSFTWGERQPHCFSGMPEFPGQTAYQRVLPLMVRRILATAPPGADVTSWRY
ncbi:MAG TPA: alpha/beta hydrolase-fold protein [Longimicrobiales bacterium]|nr:alpha/beta hydrolase-fold protein [Longimicrobiales bacterium]